MKKIFVIVIAIFSFSGLLNKAFAQSETIDIKSKAVAYFETYAAREDWGKFISFYDEDVYFEDLQFRLICSDLDSFKRFYNWHNPNFKKVDEEKPILQVTQLLVNDSVAVASGFFDSFYWQNNLIQGPWEFTITLTFNSFGKIVKQTDFINYPLYFLCGNTKLEQDIKSWMDRKKD